MSLAQGSKQFFFAKKNQKTLMSWHPPIAAAAVKLIKVFCFFFSKKKALPYLLQTRLTDLNRIRLTPTLPSAKQSSPATEEEAFLEASRASISAWAAQAPSDAPGFIAWFENLQHTGPGQNDPLFDFLAEECTLDQMRWFLAQEVAGEAGFDDLTALTLLRMPTRAKLELARNFWDEMGRGAENGMHGPMLERLADHLELAREGWPIVDESLALANIMAGLAAHRHYAYHAIGALGVVELSAPGRAAKVAKGLARLGVPPKQLHYFALHAVLDVKHSATWNAEVIVPLVTADPRFAVAIAEGALMRLSAGAACFGRYTLEFRKNLLF